MVKKIEKEPPQHQHLDSTFMSHMYARVHMHTHTLEFSSDVDFLTDTMYSNFTKTIIKNQKQ